MKCNHILSISLIVTIIYSFEIRNTNAIIGGTPVSENTKQFPYQLSIRANNKDVGGGCIIHKHFALTVAQNVINQSNQFENVQWSVVTVTKIKRNVVTLYVPKMFNFDIKDPNSVILKHDIALLQVKPEFTYTKTLAPVRTNELIIWEELQTTSYNVIVSGSGMTTRDSDTQIGKKSKQKWFESFAKPCSTFGILKFAESQLYPASKCASQYIRSITQSHLCVQMKQKDPNNPAGNCKGDLGNPLVVEKQPNRYYLLGLLSHRVPDCNENKQAALYTNYSDNIEFIMSVLSVGPIKFDLTYLRIADYKASKSSFIKKKVLVEKFTNN